MQSVYARDYQLRQQRVEYPSSYQIKLEKPAESMHVSFNKDTLTSSNFYKNEPQKNKTPHHYSLNQICLKHYSSPFTVDETPSNDYVGLRVAQKHHQPLRYTGESPEANNRNASKHQQRTQLDDIGVVGYSATNPLNSKSYADIRGRDSLTMEVKKRKQSQKALAKFAQVYGVGSPYKGKKFNK